MSLANVWLPIRIIIRHLFLSAAAGGDRFYL